MSALDDAPAVSVPVWRWLLVAAVAGVLLGPLDLWGQVHSPYPWAHLFNSPAVWAAAAFGYGRWARDRVAAPVGATVLLVVAVEAYYLADIAFRDASRANLTSSTAMVWVFAGVVAGLVFGTTGTWAAQRDGWMAIVGRAALPAVFAAEAVRNIVRIVDEPADGRPDDLGRYTVILLVLGVATFLVQLREIPRRVAIATTALALAAALLVGLAAGVLVG